MNTLQNRAVVANVSPEALGEPHVPKDRTTNATLFVQHQRQNDFSKTASAARQRMSEKSLLASKRLVELSSLARQQWAEHRAYAVNLAQNQEARNMAILLAKQRLSETQKTITKKCQESKEYAQQLASDREEREKSLKQLRTRILNEKNMVLKGKRGYFVPTLVAILVLWNCFGFNSRTQPERAAVHLNPYDAANGVSVSRRMGSRMTTALRADLVNTAVDILSIGSVLKQDYHQAQMRTLAQHPSVRHFFPITEKNDTDANCFMELTTDQLDKIIDFCSNTEKESFVSTTLRKNLFHPKRHTGWMCAQKRPLDGLYQVMEKYRTKEITIPDYLFIIEEDTFLNVDALLVDLLRNYPSDKPNAIAGCSRDFLKTAGITFPENGFGSYFTKAAIERFIAPFYCDGRDQQSTLNCWRKNVNALGEKTYYKEGMSVHQLMHAFTTAHEFTKVQEWSGSGYCMHADHALAYFTNFYHIPVPDNYLKKGEKPKDKIRRKHSFIGLQGRKVSECSNIREECTAKARICHEIQPAQMDRMHREIARGTDFVGEMH